MKGTRRILVTAIVLIAGVALGAGFLTMKRPNGPKLARETSPLVSVAAVEELQQVAAPEPKASATESVEQAPPKARAAATSSEKAVRKPIRSARPAPALGRPPAAELAGRFGLEGHAKEPMRELSKAEIATLWPYAPGMAVVPVLSPVLRETPAASAMADPSVEVENRDLPFKGRGRSPDSPISVVPDSAIQALPGPSLLTATSVNFDGLSANGFAPPDNNGRVGPNHYVQWINVNFAIYDKVGTLLYGPSAGRNLFTALGPNAPCFAHNDGDPLVVYDNLADRWILTQFAVGAPSVPT